jgi:3-isopropylmalate/(R)-2-methylmalate dehydratase small subunit
LAFWGEAHALLPLILGILSSGGILARLAERGYLPIELLDVLRSGAIPQDTGA